MFLKRMLISMLVCFVGYLQVNAQKLKFGEVPISDLKMEVYEKDSSANAVVLFDVTEAFINEEFVIQMQRHVRIKILTDNGLTEGDISLAFRHDDPEQRISKLDVRTYNLTESGKVEKSKLGKKDKYLEKTSDNWSELKFVVPNLKKGSVFEYKYKWTSESIHDLGSWYFQRNIPVKWSEYQVKIPEWFKFMIYKRSYHDFFVDTQGLYNGKATITYRETEYIQRGNAIRATEGKSYLKAMVIDYLGTEYHWVLKDLPAIENEPYMKAKSDYYASVHFQLSRVQFPNSVPENVLNTWSALAEALEKNDLFGERINESRFFKGKINDLLSDSLSETEKLGLIYDHVQKKIEWDNKYRLFAYRNLQDIYESGSGNSSEINLTLIKMLKEVGFKAYPVIISTRSNGEIIDLYPITSQFNHTLISVEVDGKTYLIDATKKGMPFSLLPAEVMNEKGLLIDGSNSRWVTVKSNTKNRHTKVLNYEIDENGNAKGVLDCFMTGQFSYLAKKEIDFLGDQNPYAGNGDVSIFDKRIEDFLIDSVSISEIGNEGAIKYKAHFQLNELASLDEEIVYLNPNVVNSGFENLFKLQNRNYPVDYEFPFSNKLTINITIPQDWQVDEIPKSVLHRLKNRDGEFRRLIQAEGDRITILYSLRINKQRIMPEDYKNLKAMYDLMEKTLNEKITLKRVINEL